MSLPKNIILLSIFLLGLSLSCCSTEPEKWETNKISTDRITIDQKTDSTITFTARSWGFNGCYKYSHNEISSVGNNINITIYGKYPTSALCTMALIPIYTQIILPVPQPATYNFHFWQSEVSSYDTTIVIP